MKLPVFLDGATGTMLQSRGMPQGACPEAWVLEHPDIILDIQRAYLEAGSNILYAPTFGANRKKLSSFGLDGKVEQINRDLVRLSKQAASGKALVAGDLSPCGEFIAPFGDSSMAQLFEIYAEQAQALHDAEVDLFVVETSMTIAEARAAFLAARAVSSKPIFVTFTCDENGRTLSGADITAALVIFQAMGAAAFGLNCSGGPAEMRANIKRLAPYARIPIIAKPNAGLPRMEGSDTVYDMQPDEFAQLCTGLYEEGARIFGGCCGTTEAHIKSLVSKVNSCAAKSPSDPPAQPAGEYLATEKAVFDLQSTEFSAEPIACSPLLLDVLMECEQEAPVIEVRSLSDAQLLEENQYAALTPICIRSDDPEALEAALRSYNGRAAVQSTLDSSILEPLCEIYGAIKIPL